MNDLAKRAVACKGWRWLPGSLEDLNGMRYRVGETLGRAWTDSVPVLDDPATLGCLFALVRAAWDDQGLRAEGTYACGEWRWRVHGGKHHGSRFAETVVAPDYASEAEALVAALEAAP